MSMAKKLWKTAASQMASALNRADEIGGEVRDYLQDRIDKSETAQKAIGKVRDLRRSKKFKDPLEGRRRENAAREADKAAATAAAPPPTAAEIAAAEANKGFGDPSIAAQIYGRTSCPWSGRSIRLLEDRKIDYDFIDLDDEEENGGLEEKLVPETKQNTVPWIYLRGKFIGGYNALSEVDRLGQLEYATMSKEERAKAGPQAAKVEIAARENTDEVAPGEA